MYHVRRRCCLAHLAGMLCGLAAFGSSEQDRALRQIVTTTACQNIRPADDYPANPSASRTTRRSSRNVGSSGCALVSTRNSALE